MKDYLVFLTRVARISFQGSWRFYAWMSFLTVIALIGLHSYARQFAEGLQTTGMTNQVSWGAYISNFTYLVGIAAAAVMLVIPAYVYRNEEMHKVVLFGELMAIAVIVMCLLFVMVDLGHLDRFHHMIPPFGIFNFPMSILSWDVVVLNGYLLLNMHICGYLLYTKYRGTQPTASGRSASTPLPLFSMSVLAAGPIGTIPSSLHASWRQPSPRVRRFSW